MITVISQTTQERENETIDLFNNIKPLLDDGYSYISALRKLGRITDKGRVFQRGWFKDLIRYGGTQGYPYEVYQGRGFKK